MAKHIGSTNYYQECRACQKEMHLALQLSPVVHSTPESPQNSAVRFSVEEARLRASLQRLNLAMTTLKQRQAGTVANFQELTLAASTGIPGTRAPRASSDAGRPCSRGSTSDTVTSAASCPSTLQARRGLPRGQHVAQQRSGGAAQRIQKGAGGCLSGPWSARPVSHGVSTQRPRATRDFPVSRHHGMQQAAWAAALRTDAPSVIPTDVVPPQRRGTALQAPRPCSDIPVGCQKAPRDVLQAAGGCAGPSSLSREPQSSNTSGGCQLSPGVNSALHSSSAAVERMDVRTAAAQCVDPFRSWAAGPGNAPAAHRDCSAMAQGYNYSVSPTSSSSGAGTLQRVNPALHVHAPLGAHALAPTPGWMVPHTANPLYQGATWAHVVPRGMHPNLHYQPASGHAVLTNDLTLQLIDSAPLAASSGSAGAPKHDGHSFPALNWQSPPCTSSTLQAPFAPCGLPSKTPTCQLPFTQDCQAHYASFSHGHAHQFVSAQPCQPLAHNRESGHPGDVASPQRQEAPSLALPPHAAGVHGFPPQSQWASTSQLGSGYCSLPAPPARLQAQAMQSCEGAALRRPPCNYGPMQCPGNEPSLGDGNCSTRSRAGQGVGITYRHVQSSMPGMSACNTESSVDCYFPPGGPVPTSYQNLGTALNNTCHGAVGRAPQTQAINVAMSHSHARQVAAVEAAQAQGAHHQGVSHGMAPPTLVLPLGVFPLWPPGPNSSSW